MMMESHLGERHCLNCRQSLRAAAQFCANCGHTTRASALVQLQPESASPQSNFASHWNELKRVGWLFGLLLSISLGLGTIGRLSSSPWPSTIASGFEVVIVLWFAGNRFKEVSPLLGIPRVDMRTVFELAILSLVFVVLMTGYFALIERAGVPMIHVSAEYRKSGWNVGLMLVFISILPAVIEELAFRGVIQSSLEHIVSGRDAWLIQAALFSVLHLLPIVFPSHFIMGLCFGYMRLRSKSLYPGMLLHGSWNALALFDELYWS